jgi:GNAT superfamily N-acetyltransferase
LSVTPRLSRLQRRLRRDGIWSTIKGFAELIRPYPYNVYRLATLSEPLPPPAGINLAFGPEDLKRLRAGHEHLPDEFYMEYKTGARTCVFACSGAQLAGIIWIFCGARRFLTLGPEDAELSYLYVLPSYRGRGLAKALYWHAARAALDSGIKTIFAVIRNDNLPSARAAQNVGFRKIADLWRPACIGPRLDSARLRAARPQKNLVNVCSA